MTQWLTTYCQVQSNREVEEAERLALPEPPTTWLRVVLDLEAVIAFRDDTYGDEPATAVYLEGGDSFTIRMAFIDFDAIHRAYRQRPS